MSAPLLQLQNIVVEHARRSVLDVPCLDILPNEVLAIVGPNGAGKSTLLRIIGLLERPPAPFPAAKPSAPASRGPWSWSPRSCS